jgi:hypothetical protein
MKTVWKLIQDELTINHEENYQKKFGAFFQACKDEIPAIEKEYRGNHRYQRLTL